MKYFALTNIILIFTTIVLYFFLWPGVFMHVATGAIQLIFFFVLLYHFKKWHKSIKVNLIIYGCLTTLIIILAWIDVNTFFGWFWGGSVALAIYFTVITFKINKIHYENTIQQ